MKLYYSDNDFQTKLILLYMLEQIEIPLTEQLILDICTTRNDWINYMECLVVFHELIKNGFIHSSDNIENKRRRYALTAKGRGALDIYYEEVDEHLRAEISEFCKTNRMYFKRLQEYIASYVKNTDGTYTVCLQIVETANSEPMFKVQIIMQSRAEAAKAVEIWTTKAPSCYELIYSNLIG